MLESKRHCFIDLEPEKMTKGSPFGIVLVPAFSHVKHPHDPWADQRRVQTDLDHFSNPADYYYRSIGFRLAQSGVRPLEIDTALFSFSSPRGKKLCRMIREEYEATKIEEESNND